MAFEWSKVGDSFESLAGLYLETERIKASKPAETNIHNYAELAGARDDITQRVNAQPVVANVGANATGVNAGRVFVAGVPVHKTALYIGVGALAAAVLFRVLK